MQDQNDEFSTTKTRHETGFKPGHYTEEKTMEPAVHVTDPNVKHCH